MLSASSSNRPINLALPSLLLILISVLGGCGTEPSFSENKVFIKRLELEIGEPLPEQGLSDVKHLMEVLFGSAEEPKMPGNEPEAFINVENLRRAAGRVFSDENDVHFGLYRNNCIRCHGTSGDGRGPAARLLSPYPRDFRLGKYKFKSTPQGTKPSKQDLARIIRHGLPGTSMPSFALLSNEDVEALVDYVIYLSIRGETERELLRRVSNSLDYSRGDRIIDASWSESDPVRYNSQLAELSEIAAGFVKNWQTGSATSPTSPIPPGDFPVWQANIEPSSHKAPKLVESVTRGKELFRSSVASCSKCHGEDGTGANAPRDYDLWTKDWAAGFDPGDKVAIQPLVRAGALKPTRLYPRNLRHGVFRGGSAPEDIYTRITQGIEGTPMPAVAIKSQNGEGLTSDQVWDLVNYVLSLQSSGSVPGAKL